MKEYDVIVVGAGPAGIFSALEFALKGAKKRVLMLDGGDDLDSRMAASKGQRPRLTGWGGAGAFSDGKLNLSIEIGGLLKNYLEEGVLEELVEYVDSLYLKFGAPEEIYGTDTAEVRRLYETAAKYDLKLIPSRIRHLGTDRCPVLLKRLWDELVDHIDIRLKSQVKEVLIEKDRARGVLTEEGEEIYGDYVILAPGRSGAQWLSKEAERLKLTTENNPVDIGLRIEVPAAIMRPLTDVTYEAKLLFYSKKFDDQVRTFCMNPYGEVVKEYNNDIATVNGHSYANKKTENTNFALLVSTNFTEPFHEPISYGRYIARLANLLGEGIIVQRLGDLQQGRRSTPERIRRGNVRPTLLEATPGDLSFVIPYRYLSDILEMLEAMENIVPGVNSRHTLFYGVEVKFYSMRLKLSRALETEIPHLFAIGDGAGISRGMVQASASGIVSAREIMRRN